MSVRERQRGLDFVTRPARVEASLWRRLREGAETACREELFDLFADLARSVAARQFRLRPPPRPEIGDYQHFAYDGLLQAIDRFDPYRGVPFPAFARRRIEGSIADGVSRMSEFDARQSQRSRLERERLRSISAHASDQPEDALQSLTDLVVGLAMGLVLEARAGVGGVECADPGPTAYDTLAYRQLQARLRETLAALPEPELCVVRQHYENGLSFAQVAGLMQISRSRVSQLHQSALMRLKKKMGSFA